MLGKIFKVAAKINALLGEEINMSNGTIKVKLIIQEVSLGERD